jgi:hypothetical protein
MPNWNAIIIADLNDARVAELITALREEALGVGQTDPTPRIIQIVVDEVRRCISFCANTPLDADTTAIPAGLKDMVVQKIFRTMKGRLLQPLSDDETAAERTYQKRLEQLTRCEWPVDKPDNPIGTAPVSPKTGVELASNTPRQATRASLNAL